MKDDPNDDVWAIFARNTGDEGFCSHDSIIASELTTVYLKFHRDGATGVAVKNTTSFQRSGDQIQIKTFPLTQSDLVLQVDLGNPNSAPLINGQLSLQWSMGSGAPAASSGGRRLLNAAELRLAGRSDGSGTSPSTLEPEERFEKMFEGLPASTQQQLKAVKREHVRPAPNWTVVRPANLTAPPNDFTSRASARVSTRGKPGALGRMAVAPIQSKLDYYKKADEVLRQSGPSPR